MKNSMLFKLKVIYNLVVKKITNDGSNYRPSPTQMLIMDYLIQHDNVRQKDLESKLNTSRSTISDVLSTMEKHNLIERKIDDKDTRTNIIVLKENAKKKKEYGDKKLEDIENQALTGIKEEDIKYLNNLLDKIIDNMKGIKE